MIRTILSDVSHRPWPLPRGTWIMQQTWHDLLFAHWPIPAAVMQSAIPPQLKLDTFDGTAWLGVVPFGMRDVYPRGTFAVPWLSSFPELNVRTYVTSHDPDQPKPGVYFFSLDAGNPLAVMLARRFFHLPYYRARMGLNRVGESVQYSSMRTHSGAPPAQFRAEYAPIGEIYQAKAGSLEHWLTERYCLYTVGRRSQLLCGDIHHRPWPLQQADAAIDINTCATAAGISLPQVAPILHFSGHISVAVWSLHEVQRPQPRVP